MFIDASAFVAIITKEQKADELTKYLQRAKTEKTTSALALFEATMGIARKLGCSRKKAYLELCAFLKVLNIRVVPIQQITCAEALDAYDLYGKGSGSGANLNLGDVFAYACAKHLQSPLLYVGEDFAKTDLG